MKKTICLASGSQSRKKVLSSGGFNFITYKPDIPEINNNEEVKPYVLRLAQEKAEVVQESVDMDASVIVAADSVAEYNNEILEKPVDFEDAVAILTKLAGNQHTFHTGMCVINLANSEKLISHTTTEVKFTNLSQSLIEKYINHFEPYIYAGGYENSLSSWFIESINGSQSNLMGLPMHQLRASMEEFGYDIFDFIS